MIPTLKIFIILVSLTKIVMNKINLNNKNHVGNFFVALTKLVTNKRNHHDTNPIDIYYFSVT